MISSLNSVLLLGEPYTNAPPIGHFHVAKIGHYHVGATAVVHRLVWLVRFLVLFVLLISRISPTASTSKIILHFPLRHSFQVRFRLHFEIFSRLPENLLLKDRSAQKANYSLSRLE